jgi:uncharacterized flavoprotein (TIGR03862 family)
VEIAPLRPANCGFDVAWSTPMQEKFAGAPLKNVVAACGALQARGEAVITRAGLEGGVIYALSAALREEIEARGSAEILIDLRPDISLADLERRLAAAKPGQSLANLLRKAAGLTPAAIAVVREGGPVPRDSAPLARRIKAAAVRLAGVQPIGRAISSAGGIEFSELDDGLMLRRLPGVFAAGEMLDWEAPTGGYLLQACLATGRAAGLGALRFLGVDFLNSGIE